MSMPLSTWSIKNPVPPIVFFLVLTIAGLVAFKKLPVNNMPNIVVPIVRVTITQPGATAEEIETEVTRNVESGLSNLKGIKHITSSISEGLSTTSIEFNLDVNVDRAVNDTRDSVAKVRDKLPKSIQEPSIERIDIDSGILLIYNIVASEMSPEDLNWFVDDALTRELLAVSGVASVTRQGGIEHEITISLNPSTIAAFGISAADISRQLAQTNIDLPGGRVTLSGTEYSLRAVGSATTLDVLKETRIALSNGRNVKLSDLGDVRDGGAEARNMTKLDGIPAVTIMIYRTQGSSDVTVGDSVDKKLAEIGAQHPDIYMNKIFSTVTFTEKNYTATKYNFIEGAILTIMVVFLFLRDRRATLIAAVAIPLSIIPTFLFLYMFGFTLNAISLLAISLVTGVLVDDAIVEIENIHRHMREGRTPYDAAVSATAEIGLAVVATTFVICAVFTPVSFMGGIPGQYFKQFGLTVAVAAFFSLLVARMMTPLLAAYLLKQPEEKEFKRGVWLDKYHNILVWTLSHRLATIGIAAASVVFSLGLIPFLPSGFIPYDDFSQSHLKLELPSGSTLAQTDAAAQQLVGILKKHKEVMYVLTSVAGGSVGTTRPSGSGGPSTGVNRASIEVKLVPKNERNIDQRAFENKILPELRAVPDVRVNFANASGSKDVTIALVSENGDLLEKAAASVEREMRTIKELSSVGTSASLKDPEILITPDFAKAAQLGVSIVALSEAIKVATIGDNDANLAKFNYGSRQIPIRVRLPEKLERSLSVIENIQLPTSVKGKSVPLSAISTISFGYGLSTIRRYDRQRRIALEANLNGIPLGDALKKIYDLPSMKNLPKEVGIKSTGDAEVMAELFAGFALAIATGLLMVYAIQVLLYKDWIQPFTRMVALPLSIGGAFIFLLITGTDLTLPALIGILMLMGIADKNSILLVDYMLELISRGVPRQEAIMEACMVRARPIIMTSLAMLAGMLPIAFQLGHDNAFRAPMAIAVMGGLISSTALSLIFVPVIFSYVRDFEDWIKPKLVKLIS